MNWGENGVEGVRTPDPQTASLMLSQLSYYPKDVITYKIIDCLKYVNTFVIFFYKERRAAASLKFKFFKDFKNFNPTNPNSDIFY